MQQLRFSPHENKTKKNQYSEDIQPFAIVNDQILLYDFDPQYFLKIYQVSDHIS